MVEILDDATKRLRHMQAAAETARAKLAEVKASSHLQISIHDLDLALDGMSPQTRIETKMSLVRAAKVSGHSDTPILRQPPRLSELQAQHRGRPIQPVNSPGHVSHIAGATIHDAPIRVDNMLYVEMIRRGIKTAEGDDGRTLSIDQYNRMLQGTDPIARSFLVSTMREAAILPIGVG
jgi:hypothetical protein